MNKGWLQDVRKTSRKGDTIIRISLVWVMNTDMSLLPIERGVVTYSSQHALLNLYSASHVISMSKIYDLRSPKAWKLCLVKKVENCHNKGSLKHAKGIY